MDSATHKSIALSLAAIGFIVALLTKSQPNIILAVPILIFGLYTLVLGKLHIHNDKGTIEREVSNWQARGYAMLYILLAIVIFFTVR